MSLRDYQIDVKNNIYNSWASGNKNVLAVIPTGGGKTKLFSNIIYEHHKAGQKFAAIAHRNELVSQISCEIAANGTPHRIIGSNQTISHVTSEHRKFFGKSFINPSAPSAVVGVDTLSARCDDLKGWAEQIDLWVGDEDHHRVKGNKWGTTGELFTNAKGLGVTATPVRSDGKGLGRHADGYMDDMIVGPSTRWLMDNGYLAEYEIACPLSDFHIDEEKRGVNGDFTPAELRKASKNSKIVGDVVETYLKMALYRQAIVFATDIETANEISKKFNDYGIRSVSLNGKTLPKLRNQSLELFSLKKIQILVNVDLFDEGFNCPSADVCIMARPTASLSKFLQMIGRVLRPQDGKIALIIDHVSNILRHKYPDTSRDWTLNRRDKRGKRLVDPDEIPLTRCAEPTCNKPYEKFRISCPWCGSEKPLPDSRSRSIEMVDGDLILLDRETLAKMRGSTALENPAAIAQRVASATGNVIAAKSVANRQIEKISSQKELESVIAQWAGVMRHREYTDREIHKIFYGLSGNDMLSVLSAEKSRKDYDEASKIIRSWYE